MATPMYFNGRFTTTDERVVSVEDRGFQYGDGVYEVLKFLDRSIILGSEHLDRFDRSLHSVGIPNPLKRNEWLSVMAELIEQSGTHQGTLYLQVTRGEAVRSHLFPEDISPTRFAYARHATFPDWEKCLSGVDAITAPDQRWGRCDVKSVSLLGSVLARQEAHRRGAAEAVLIRDDAVTEGAHSNVFFVLDQALITHPADCRILAGTVRREVLRIAQRLGIAVEERPLRLEELKFVDEAFLSSTTLGVMPIRNLDGRRIPENAVSLSLAEAFSAFERALAAGSAGSLKQEK